MQFISVIVVIESLQLQIQETSTYMEFVLNALSLNSIKDIYINYQMIHLVFTTKRWIKYQIEYVYVVRTVFKELYLNTDVVIITNIYHNCKLDRMLVLSRLLRHFEIYFRQLFTCRNNYLDFNIKMQNKLKNISILSYKLSKA